MRSPSEKRLRSAVVVPFPYSHRWGFIMRQALRAAELNSCAGERHVQYQVQIQIDAMRRRGIGEEVILREARCLEAAIRSTLAVIDPPGGGR